MMLRGVQIQRLPTSVYEFISVTNIYIYIYFWMLTYRYPYVGNNYMEMGHKGLSVVHFYIDWDYQWKRLNSSCICEGFASCFSALVGWIRGCNLYEYTVGSTHLLTPQLNKSKSDSKSASTVLTLLFPEGARSLRPVNMSCYITVRIRMLCTPSV